MNCIFTYLRKLTSIYIFKLGISHYVSTEATEVIHVSTVKLVFIGTHQKQALYVFVFLGTNEVLQVFSL